MTSERTEERRSITLHDDHLLRIVIAKQEECSGQLAGLTEKFSRVDERMKWFTDHSEERADEHSQRLDEATRDAARAAAQIRTLDSLIRSFIEASTQRQAEQSAQISKAASDALSANSRIDRWQSKVDLIAFVASIIGVSGIASVVSALLKGFK